MLKMADCRKALNAISGFSCISTNKGYVVKTKTNIKSMYSIYFIFLNPSFILSPEFPPGLFVNLFLARRKQPVKLAGYPDMVLS